MWLQRPLLLPPVKRGFHLVTPAVVQQLPELASLSVGLLHVFIQHTSASLSINENADRDVRRDFEMAFSHIVPESLDYVHTLEGPDDMPAHIKASLLGSSVSIPVSGGQLALGTWQGIYLCASARRLVLTLQGQRGQGASD
jgi:secondary thiamine-phosphate synthase enzyme